MRQRKCENYSNRFCSHLPTGSHPTSRSEIPPCCVALEQRFDAIRKRAGIASGTCKQSTEQPFGCSRNTVSAAEKSREELQEFAATHRRKDLRATTRVQQSLDTRRRGCPLHAVNSESPTSADHSSGSCQVRYFGGFIRRYCRECVSLRLSGWHGSCLLFVETNSRPLFELASNSMIRSDSQNEIEGKSRF